jgi:signal transduction histidine kinase
LNQFYAKLAEQNRWIIISLAIASAVLITNSLTSILTLVVWNKIVIELLVLGTLNSIVVPALLSPLLINLIQSKASLEEHNRQLHVENVERMQTELEAKLHAESMAAISQLAVQCATTTADTDLLVLIAATLQSITHSFAVLITTFDPGSRKLTVRHAAVSGSILETASKLIGQNIIGMQVPVNDEWLDHMRKQTVFVSDNLYELSMGALPKPVTTLVQRTLGIGGLTGLAFNHGGEIFGTAMIVMHRHQPPISVDLAKTFANVAAVSLRRNQLEREREKLIAELGAKNTELEQFTYTVSHDLKSPLITIRGFLGLLKRDLEQGDQESVQSDVQRIHNAADKMQRLLEELLELSRIGRMMNPPENVPFEKIVREALALVDGRLRERRVQIEISPNLPIVHGDRLRLVEVMQNLIDNAAKFMGEQTHPRIEIGILDHSQDGKPILFVRDNGIGMAPQYHDKIFGLFNKLNGQTEGTGIGLALVKRIVEVHGGKIWVESQMGQGSTFYFTLTLGTR